VIFSEAPGKSSKKGPKEKAQSRGKNLIWLPEIKAHIKDRRRRHLQRVGIAVFNCIHLNLQPATPPPQPHALALHEAPKFAIFQFCLMLLLWLVDVADRISSPYTRKSGSIWNWLTSINDLYNVKPYFKVRKLFDLNCHTFGLF